MKREDALKILKSKLKKKNLIKHSLACEAGMKGVAEFLGEDTELWGLAGLLHDIDYDEIECDEEHGKKGAEYLKDKVDKRIVNAVERHTGYIKPETTMELSLYALDPLTGLIVACMLVHPSKSFTGIDTDFILRKFKQKGFAKGANREQILTCDKIGIPLIDFVDIVLKAMQKINDELT
ncbi:HDIG domain-containing protein [candidate division WOR-3 bacterium]|nr:HDIG domain-containing protein [candidate division WOR-3 bacterium]